jgi:Tyrosine-protein kinase ephrin type A/B receptor-like/Folate receptor family
MRVCVCVCVLSRFISRTTSHSRTTPLVPPPPQRPSPCTYPLAWFHSPLLLSVAADIPTSSSCPLHDPFPSLFPSDEPQRVASLSACPQYTQSSCCSIAYNEEVRTAHDLISQSVRVLIPQPQGVQCFTGLDLLRCLPCSPFQNHYVHLRPSQKATLSVCESVCDQLYTDCSLSVVALQEQTVAERFDNGYAFCEALFRYAGAADREFALQLFVDSTNDAAHCLSAARECRVNDYQARYTACDADSTTRQLIYVLADPANICQGGAGAPPSVVDLPCHVPCDEGSYLPLGELECAVCAPGSYSLGGGFREDTWKTLPEDLQVRTYCVDEQGNRLADSLDCGWHTANYEAHSGAVGDAQASVMEFDVTMVREGHVRFEYRVNAELGFDGLYFYVDGSLAGRYLNNPDSFEEQRFPLSPGSHSLRWSYRKDYSVAVGDDAAYLRMVEVSGMTWADDSCTNCPPGTSSGAGRSECDPCPANTYAAGVGNVKCQPCPSGTYSFQGARVCPDRELCTEDDRLPRYTDCEGGSRTLYYEWNLPVICDSEHSELPRPIVEHACAPCNPGFHRVTPMVGKSE